MTSSSSAVVPGDGADVSVADGVRPEPSAETVAVSSDIAGFVPSDAVTVPTAGADVSVADSARVEASSDVASSDVAAISRVVAGSQVGSVLWDKFTENPLPSVLSTLIAVMLGFVLTTTNERIGDANNRITSLEVKVDSFVVKVGEEIDALRSRWVRRSTPLRSRWVRRSMPLRSRWVRRSMPLKSK